MRELLAALRFVLHIGASILKEGSSVRRVNSFCMDEKFVLLMSANSQPESTEVEAESMPHGSITVPKETRQLGMYAVRGFNVGNTNFRQQRVGNR